MIFNIKLPVVFDDRFIPPELEQVFDFYPEFVKKYGKPLSFQAYMSLIIKEIDKTKPNGFDGQSAFDAYVSHSGGGLERFMEKYKDFALPKSNDSFGQYVIKNVLIQDFWDRSPCTWVCNIMKLDLTDPIQKDYYDSIQEGLKDSHDGVIEDEDEGDRKWYYPGGCRAKDSFSNGRPDEVEHAAVMPPCKIDAMIIIYYE